MISAMTLKVALTGTSAAITLLLAGAIAGFFYAYSSSVMFGLDAVDPRHAIVSMQGINARVRNAVFFPAFFLTPVAAVVTAGLLVSDGHKVAAGCMAAAATVYVGGGFLPTVLINVPMNEALAIAGVSGNVDEAAKLWSEYSARWSWWNGLRTVFSMISLLLVGAGIYAWGRKS
jgi:uncharacterized membrane protein